MASDRAKWSNYIHSHISGTKGVNTTPFFVGTQAMVPEHQVWTAPQSQRSNLPATIRAETPKLSLNEVSNPSIK